MNRNRDVLDVAVAAWNAADLEGYLTLYDDSIRLHGYGPEPLAKPAVREFYKSIFGAFTAVGAASPALRVEDVVEEGDRMAMRFTMGGEHRGEFMGVPATGRPVALPGITILHFRDGRVIERWTSAVMLGLMVQIGALPVPGG